MFTSPTPSARQTLTSICPRFEAAAVCTSAVWPSWRIVSTIARAVSGLTNIDAPSAVLAPSGSTTHDSAGSRRSSAYIAPPSIPTLRPSSARPAQARGRQTA